MYRALLGSVLLFSLVFAACGGGDGDTTPAGETAGAGGTVTIDLWHSETAANLDTLERMISRYNSSQGEVKVRLFYQGNE